MASTANETMAFANEASNDNDEIEYSHVEDTDPDQQQYYYQGEYSHESHPSMAQAFQAHPYDAYSLQPDQLTSVIEIHPEYPVKPDFEIKEERMDDVIFLNRPDEIYEVLDSDEEEALHSRDSGRETNDTAFDADTSHIPMMGVLMMAKK